MLKYATRSALTSNASTFPTVVGAVNPGFATIKLSMDGAEAAVVIISLRYFLNLSMDGAEAAKSFHGWS